MIDAALEEIDFDEVDARVHEGVARSVPGSLDRPGPGTKLSTDGVIATLALVDAALADEPAAQRGREDAAMIFALHDLEEELLVSPDLETRVDRVIQVVGDLTAVSQTLDAYESAIARRAEQTEADAAQIEVKKAFERVAARRFSELQAADCRQMEQFAARRARIERALLDQREAEKQTAEQQQPKTAAAIQAPISAPIARGARWTSDLFTPEQRMLAGLLAYHKVKNGDRPEYRARMVSLRQALGSNAVPFERTLATLMTTAVQNGRVPSDEPSVTGILAWAAPLRNGIGRSFDSALVNEAYETVMGPGMRPASIEPITNRPTPPIDGREVKRGDGPSDPSR